MADLTSNKMSNQAGTAKKSKAVASLRRASFNEYEAKLEGEVRHAMKHVTEVDDSGAQDLSPTVKVRTDASEANGYKQGEGDSNKKQESGTSRIKTNDREILRRSSHNNANKDEPAVKHVAAEQMEEADEMEEQKPTAKGKVRVDSSEATDNKQGEENSNKAKQRNKLSKIKTIDQGILRRSPRSKTKEEAVEAIILNPYQTQTAKKCMLEISDMQKGNDADSEMKDSRHSVAVATEEVNVTSGISEQKNTKQSEVSFLENKLSKVKVTRPKKRKYSKAHEEAKRLVILELAKLRSTVNHESQMSDLKGDSGVKRPQQNDSAKLQYREVEDEPAQAVINQLSAHKSVKGQKTKRQCVNDVASGDSRGKNAKQDGSSRRKPEKSQNIQSPYMASHHSPEEIGDISSRKTRVMQSLGLVAPPGSPFRRNGSVQNARLKV